MIKEHNIYLLGLEEKDTYCLSPLHEALKSRFRGVFLIKDLVSEIQEPEFGLVGRLAQDKFPVTVSSSVSILDHIALFRNRSSYMSIGIEHGIAPFKMYTYGAHFQKHDAYMAPTKIWLDRLKRLYPENKDRFLLGGYPRLEHLRDLRAKSSQYNNSLPYHWRHSHPGQRKLVIFSWGVKKEALEALPDKEGIVYLLHPASLKLSDEVKFERASCLLSEPNLTSDLLATTDRVYGDFSSMSLEALALGMPVHIFIDRSLYANSCDLGEGFFNRDHEAFGRVPHTRRKLDLDQIMTATELSESLAADIDTDLAPPSSRLDLELLPPIAQDNRELCANAIFDFVCQNYDRMAANAVRESGWQDRLAFMRFLGSAYQAVLGRRYDKHALEKHFAAVEFSDSPAPVLATRILASLMKSPSAIEYMQQNQTSWPVVPNDWMKRVLSL
ncbi:hypothetical protein [Brevundimonas guildfordensis]|uniref:Uncharacterized protein n=1 Tax=Brevundimonas guildfordensis TaxID=2762241 RepID=A0ABR8R1R3_9CAUL|nr:hypothetical protein [Brevundimonas guildfordensis]MBD7941723.1 hypothetical protein [Brevundimonas guildfordensis]